MAGSHSLLLAVYRTLCRHAEVLRKEAKTLNVRLPIEGGRERWGTFAWTPRDQTSVESLFRKLLPNVSEPPIKTELSGEEIKDCIKKNFRQPPLSGRPENEALHCMRVVGEQFKLHECSSRTTTDGVQVEATSTFIGRDKDLSGRPANLFSYRIRVENMGDSKVQLTSRHWMLKDGETVQELVHKGSPGVVGQFPIFEPGTGKCFEYVSGCMTTQAQAEMWGSFQMLSLGEHSEIVKRFDAEVGPFKLLVNR